MSWQVEIVEVLRNAIGDICDSPTYSDDRLERAIISAGVQVLNETDFDNNYSIDITNGTIIPDPTDQTVNPVKDISFVALVALKAASLIARAELKLGAAAAGLIVKDGPSTIDTSNRYGVLMGVYKQFIDDYEFLKMNYKLIRSNANAQAILTSTTVRQIYGNLEVLGY